MVGWSRAAVQRHKRWLYSVEAPSLSGVGDAITLTLRDTPPDVDQWAVLLRLERHEGMTQGFQVPVQYSHSG